MHEHPDELRVADVHRVLQGRDLELLGEDQPELLGAARPSGALPPLRRSRRLLAFPVAGRPIDDRQIERTVAGLPDAVLLDDEALAAIDAIAASSLPPGMKYEWTELTYQQILAGNSAVFVFPLCVLLVFLVLAAQCESWSLPLSVILIVPMCLLAAIAGVWIDGSDNNIFMQIGLFVLVGLVCKNAILLVEFAKDHEEHEKSDPITAVLEACRRASGPS